MGDDYPEHGLDPTGFLVGGIISTFVVLIDTDSFIQIAWRVPLYTAVIGAIIGVAMYALARRSYFRGYGDAVQQAKKIEDARLK